MLSVELKWKTGRNWHRAATVEEALAHYVAPECTERKCPDDACPRENIKVGTRILFITPLPPVLILHLKRFQSEGTKIDHDVRFSLTSQLPGHPNIHFKLYAITCHEESQGGHYTTFIRKLDAEGDEQWFLTNDMYVEEVTVGQVLSTSDAYLLFYEQQTDGYQPEKESTECSEHGEKPAQSNFSDFCHIVEQAKQTASNSDRMTTRSRMRKRN